MCPPYPHHHRGCAGRGQAITATTPPAMSRHSGWSRLSPATAAAALSRQQASPGPQLLQLRPPGPAPRRMVGPDLPAPCRDQIVDLRVRVLLGPRYLCAAEQMRRAPDRTANPRPAQVATHTFRTPVALHRQSVRCAQRLGAYVDHRRGPGSDQKRVCGTSCGAGERLLVRGVAEAVRGSRCLLAVGGRGCY